MAHEVRDCRWPWNRLYLHANGDIKPCCYATSPVGNVMDGDKPEEIWNGKEMQELRQYIVENRIHPVCAGAGCSFIRSRMAPDEETASQVVYRKVPEGVVLPHTEALAKLGQRDALWTLGHSLLEKAGQRPSRLTMRFVKDSALAYLWLYRASRKRSELASYRLALSLFEWNSRLVNGFAFSRAKQAGESGYAQAYILAGRILIEGKGMGRKVTEAKELFRKGAELGDPMGYYLLGCILKTDPTQVEEARKLLTLAKRRGVAEADAALEYLQAA
jgi:TPR repeat protein